MTPLRTGLSLILALVATSVAADDQSVIYVEPDRLDQYWTANNLRAPEYPRVALRDNREGCVAVSFIIEQDGRTSSHTPLVTFPDSIFNRAAIKATKAYRYEPTAKNTAREPVLTFMTFAFALATADENHDSRHASLNVACTDAALERIAELMQKN